MPFCPECRSEFLPGVAFCATCEVALVESLEQVKPLMDDRSMMEYLNDKELAVVLQAPLDQLKRVKNLFCQNAIANVILRKEGSCSTGGCSPSLDLAVAAEDLQRAAEVLQNEFQELVATVANENVDPAQFGDALDLEAEQITCPACEAVIPQGVNECPGCGLYVGIPEGF